MQSFSVWEPMAGGEVFGILLGKSINFLSFILGNKEKKGKYNHDGLTLVLHSAII